MPASGTQTTEQEAVEAPPHPPERPIGRRRGGLVGWLGFSTRLMRREFGIGEASVVLMVSFFSSAVLGAIRQALLNRQFGADETAGAYYASARLPDTLFTLVAGGALSSAFIPVLLSTRRGDGSEAAWRLTSLVLNSLVLVMTVLTVLGEVLAPFAVRNLLVPGYTDAHQAQATDLTRIMLLQPVVLAVGSVVTALLNSRNRFLLPAIAVTSHNIGVIAGIGASMIWPSVGIYGPAWGTVAGTALQVGLMVPGLRGDDLHYRPLLDFGDTRLREVLRLLLPNGLGLAVGFGSTIVDSSFASRLDEEAALPALHNAWLLVGLPITLAGTAVGQAAFPRLAAHAAAGDIVRMRNTLLRILGVAMALAIPALIVLVALGMPTIDILFVHGKFHADDGDLTYKALLGYVVGLPAFVATELASRGLLALRDARTPFLTNCVQLLLRIVLCAALVGPFGLVGIALSSAAAAAIETVILLIVLRRKVR